MSLRPTYDKVLIRPDTQPAPYEQDASHTIVLPEKYHYGPWDVAHVGTILAKGPQVTLELKRGDRVYYGKFGFAKFMYQEKLYVIVKQDDILVIAE